MPTASNVEYTDKEISLGKEIYKPDRAAITIFSDLIHLLKWEDAPNPKSVRVILGNFREAIGQQNAAYKYCEQLYKNEYCICGAKACGERQAHTTEEPNSTGRRHHKTNGYNAEYYDGAWA